MTSFVEASSSDAAWFADLTSQLGEAEEHIAAAGNRFDVTVARRELIEQCRRIAAMEA